MTDTWQRPPSIVHQGWRYTIAGISCVSLTISLMLVIEDKDVPGLRDRLIAAIHTARDWGQPTPAGNHLIDVADDFAMADTERELNAAMTELYDWGDEHRVIVG